MLPFSVPLDTQQPVEERAIPLQRDTQIFRRDVVTATPLAFELRTFIGKTAGQPFDYLSDESVGLLNRATGLVDESPLDFCPAIAKIRGFIFWKQRRRLIDVGFSCCSLAFFQVSCYFLCGSCAITAPFAVGNLHCRLISFRFHLYATASLCVAGCAVSSNSSHSAR